MPTSPDIRISILIATANRPESLRQTLTSICQAGIPEAWSVDLIVVENGRKSGAEQVVHELPPTAVRARYLYEPKPSKSHALNYAIAVTTGQIILFTDDDVRVPHDWITSMCTPLVSGETAVVVGGCCLAPHLRRPWMKRHHRTLLASTEFINDITPADLAGVNFAVRREVFNKVPAFDCELGGGGLGNGEDTLFAFQLKHAGYKFLSRLNVRVEHHPSESRLSYSSWVRAVAAHGRSTAYLMYHWEHTRIPQARWTMLYLILKLHIRRLATPHTMSTKEGIRLWEFCYRFEIEKRRHYLRISSSPRKYAKYGLVKLKVGA